MELKHLRHFTAVVDHGTFLKAADAVAISQPALSRSIQSLEADLGTTLLDRTTRGLELTAAGKRFYDRSKLILNEAAVAVAEVQSEPSKSTPFNIGLAPMFAADIMPTAISAFTEANPELAVSVRTGLFTDLIERLSKGELDIVYSNIPFAPVPETLSVEPMLDIEVCYVACAAHPLARRKQVPFTDLTNYPWAVVDEANANTLYSYIFNQEGETQSPINMTTNSLSFLKSLVKTPNWISLLPKHMVVRDIERGEVAILDVKMDKLQRKAGLIFRNTSAASPNIQAFTRFIKQATQKH